MNGLVTYLSGKGAVHRNVIARDLNTSIREVRWLAEDTRLHSTTWHTVVLSTQDGLRLAHEPGELIDEAARIRSQHLRAMSQCKVMESLALAATQAKLALAWLLLIVPWSLLAQ